MGDEPIITMQGERVALGPMRRELVPTYMRWLNDLAVARNLGPIRGPVTEEAELAWFERAVANDAAAHFTIYAPAAQANGALAHDPSNGAGDDPGAVWSPIGTTALLRVDWRNRTAEYALVIGEATARGRGYGTEVTRLMLDYAFTALGLHSGSSGGSARRTGWAGASGTRSTWNVWQANS